LSHTNHVVVTSLSPGSSSGLPLYLGDALRAFATVEHASPPGSPLRRLAQAIATFHPNRKRWRDALERESEHRIASWERFSRALQRDERVTGAGVVLQVGLHFDSFPSSGESLRLIYLHGTLSMILRSRYDCSMWCPPMHEVPRWIKAECAVLRKADRIYIGSAFLRDELADRYGVERDKIVLAGTGCPTLPDVSISARSVGQHREGMTFLFVGKDFERKGGEVLLTAFERVGGHRPGTRLRIVGPRAVGRRLPPGVELVGPVADRAAMSALFAEADVFVMPSLHDSFGFVFLEAMHFGLPCIGTDIFAIPDIIRRGETGLIVEPGNAAELASAMIWMLENPEPARKMGLEGKKRVARDFRWSDVAAAVARDLPAAGSPGKAAQSAQDAAGAT